MTTRPPSTASFHRLCFLSLQTQQGHSWVVSVHWLLQWLSTMRVLWPMANICLFHYKLFRARCTFYLLCRGHSLLPTFPLYKRQKSSQWMLHQLFLSSEWETDHLKNERTTHQCYIYYVDTTPILNIALKTQYHTPYYNSKPMTFLPRKELPLLQYYVAAK